MGENGKAIQRGRGYRWKKYYTYAMERSQIVKKEHVTKTITESADTQQTSNMLLILKGMMKTGAFGNKKTGGDTRGWEKRLLQCTETLPYI